jgi:hypothetical protein
VPMKRHKNTPTLIHPEARTMRLRELEQRIARAEYAVDPDAVADAVMRRLDLAPRGRESVSPRCADSRSRPAARKRRTG